MSKMTIPGDFRKLRLADRYQITESGMIRGYWHHLEEPSNPDTIRTFPQVSGTELYDSYLEWAALGNVIEPEFTPEELLERLLRQETADLKESLRSANVWQFRMLLELFKLLKAATVVTNDDVDPEIMAKAQDWTIKLNRLKELGD